MNLNCGQVVKLLLKHNINSIVVPDENGRTGVFCSWLFSYHSTSIHSVVVTFSVIHWATKNESFKCMDMLLKLASVDLVNACDHEQACGCVVQLLLG